MISPSLKIGFITSLSGPAGVIGKHMKDSVELALDHVGRKVGGMETEIIYGDDQRKRHDRVPQAPVRFERRFVSRARLSRATRANSTFACATGYTSYETATVSWST